MWLFGFCLQLLKSEIRRLERNQEREKSVANLEYLKNVLLQFIFLKSGSERESLLPVIDTMLQLSPEEKGKLVAIAQGTGRCFATGIDLPLHWHTKENEVAAVWGEFAVR